MSKELWAATICWAHLFIVARPHPGPPPGSGRNIVAPRGRRGVRWSMRLRGADAAAFSVLSLRCAISGQGAGLGTGGRGGAGLRAARRRLSEPEFRNGIATKNAKNTTRRHWHRRGLREKLSTGKFHPILLPLCVLCGQLRFSGSGRAGGGNASVGEFPNRQFGHNPQRWGLPEWGAGIPRAAWLMPENGNLSRGVRKIARGTPLHS